MDHEQIMQNTVEEEYNEVTLLDDSGKEVRFDHLLTFFYEKEKYIALMPLDDVEQMDEGEVLLLHVVDKGGEEIYEIIENEVLLEEVFNEFLELFEEVLEQED